MVQGVENCPRQCERAADREAHYHVADLANDVERQYLSDLVLSRSSQDSRHHRRTC